jgi:hypothetical protein
VEVSSEQFIELSGSSKFMQILGRLSDWQLF